MHNRSIRKFNKMMAYIYMPLFFSILSYGIVYLMYSDMISLATNVISLISSDYEPTFSLSNRDVFNIEEPVVPSEDNTIKLSDITRPQFGDLYAYVKCSDIGLDAPVYWGDTNELAKLGATQHSVSYMPGFGGLLMIGAHNNTFFNCLKNIEIGHIITIETSYGTYTYKVASTEVVDVTEEGKSEVYNYYTDYEHLILYTCYPFDMLSHTNNRFMVHADFVSGPTVVD